ncbi:molybdopterin dinucleotide-binding protein [Gordonibacter sp. An232A]|uniref:Molybdopterin-dependent oxidoreductase n=1 Tax=Rubneribacter badeniensis TaxID=2070688 RepID=A0A9D2VM42_9ACTN|nr:molybdopterin dinucleotide-binding protein [Gordonibacter sp. An232A]HJH44480.1 molybdopterin-dependent oxidoreductase [Rubneribacter badeniensis]
MGRLSMTRRTFAKVAAVTAAALGATATAGQALAEQSDAASASAGEVKRIRSCCRGCGKMECGVWVTVQDGKVVKTEGDESAFQSAGNHCAKGQASLQAAYHPDRLRYPLKRTRPKGEDPAWERITWDEAYQLTADGIHANQEKYGKETCIFMGGTSRIWSMAPYGAFKQCFGSPNGIQANEICKGPRFYATTLNASNAYSWMEVVGRPRVFVQWGGASELSNYDDSCRMTVEVATRADKHIIVDPRQTNLGKEADIWVNLRPGTDGAVANCWAQVIIENDLIDDLYVRKWMNAPMLVVEEESFQPTPCSSAEQSASIVTRLLKESDIKEGGSDGRFMVINELTGNLSYYDTTADNPGWEGEDWTPATEGFVPQQAGLDEAGQEQGFVLDYVPFPDGLYPALFTEEGGREITLKDGTVVHVRTVRERYIDFLQDYTPEKVEEISGVAADTLREAAIIYATRIDPSTGYGNGGIQYMLAPEHACNSVQNQRACDLVCGITGNMDVPGGMRGSTPGWPYFDLAMCNPDSKEIPAYDSSKILGSENFPMIGSDCGPGWADATSIYDAIESGQPYNVTCGIGQTGDFMNQSNSLFAVEQLMKLDFWCSIDLWHTPCVDMVADVVMPAAHWLELDCIRKSQGSSGAFGATVKAVDPPGEAKNDLEIVVGIFKAAGVPYFDEATHGAKWLEGDEAVKHCNEIGLANFRILDWEDYKAEFQEKGWFDSKVEKPEDWGTYRRYQIGNGHISGGFPPTPVQRQGWNTTTHKQEIWSTVLESWLVNGVANDGKPEKVCYTDEEFTPDEVFPKYWEAPHGPVKDPDLFADDNSFLMTTGRRQGTYFHSEHRQLPWCRELWPVPRLEMNPVDAERLGLEQGDWVWIETDQHKIREVVDLYYGIAPGVVNAEHQWWYPELSQVDHGFKLSGVNCLIDRHAQDRICGSSNLRAYGVKVYKATPENSPFGNPVPCGDDGTEIIHTCDDPRLKDWMPDYESARGEA